MKRMFCAHKHYKHGPLDAKSEFSPVCFGSRKHIPLTRKVYIYKSLFFSIYTYVVNQQMHTDKVRLNIYY